MKSALITGITGQDGSYLAELLLDKGYKVFGLARRTSWFKPHAASHIASKINVLFGDLSEGMDIASAVADSAPDEIYNLASQSRPGESWARAPETLTVNGLAAVRLFEAVRHNFPKCRVYHASSSEMFGRSIEAPQSENTLFDPVNPYATAKVYAHQMARIYRESYGLFIACGILFNHESPRRPRHFLTQKIAHGAACAALGIKDSPILNEVGQPIVKDGKLALGNLSVSRDWGFAGDFVKAMHLVLQQDKPEDYVIGTGELHSLENLCNAAYDCVGRDWRESVFSDPALVRPLEPGRAVADRTKARVELGWEPEVGFESMVEAMVRAQITDLEAHERRRRDR
jgi:GDPmannose 4,6-dehydratase